MRGTRVAWGARMLRNTTLCGTLIAAAACASESALPEPPDAGAGDTAIDCRLPSHFKVQRSGHVVVEGDIVVGTLAELEAACAAGKGWPGVRGTLRGVGVEDPQTWPAARVYYDIDDELPDHDRVLDAIADWEAETVIDFVRINATSSTTTNHVWFTNGDWCTAELGMQGNGRQHVWLSEGKAATEIVGMSISSLGTTYTWYADGQVTAGSTDDLDSDRGVYNYDLPSGYSASQIVGIGIAKSTDRVYVWYSDRKVSVGTTSDFDAYLSPRTYTLPTGKSVSQIVDIDIASDDDVYTWFSDRTVTIGTSTDLDAQSGPYAFTMPLGKTAGNIVGIGIAPAGDVYAWYDDQQVSAGSSSDLDSERATYAYTLPIHCGKSSVVHEIGHAVGLHHEQNRCDRDLVARVFWDNILDGEAGNFTKQCAGARDLGGYNANSMMHYSSYGFSDNGSPTLLRLVPAGLAIPTADVVDMSISPSGDIYTWWTDGFVTVGSSYDLELYRSRYRYTLPADYDETDIAGIAIAKGSGDVYTFYKNGKRSVGESANLASISAPATYTLPSGYAPDHIVAVDMAPSGSTYVWFNNGQRYYGNSLDLGANGGPNAYSLPSGKSRLDILGIAISAGGDTYAWYDDGEASSGTTTDFDAVRTPYEFSGRLTLFTPGSTINTGDADAVLSMYGRQCPYDGDYLACVQVETVDWCKAHVLNCEEVP